jgi:hypothetical protein
MSLVGDTSPDIMHQATQAQQPKLGDAKLVQFAGKLEEGLGDAGDSTLMVDPTQPTLRPTLDNVMLHLKRLTILFPIHAVPHDSVQSSDTSEQVFTYGSQHLAVPPRTSHSVSTENLKSPQIFV